MSSKMLGKLETVFSYTAHFILQSWPEKRPGILFLTDSGGRVINFMDMQAGQSWNPQGLHLKLHSVASGNVFELIAEAAGSRRIVMKAWEGDPNGYGAIPLREKDGSVRAVIGIITPLADIDFDLCSYMRGLEPMIRMGYDAYIQHATSQIVMDLNLYDTTHELLESLISHISDIIQKGYCSAVKLSEDGFFIPQECVTTERTEGSREIAQIVGRMGQTPVLPSTHDANRIVVVPMSCNSTPLYALVLHLPPDETECVYDERDVAFLQEVGEKASNALWRAVVSDELRREAGKKDLMYQLMSKIQASIDVNDVLHEIVTSIPILYPHLSVELFLTVEPNATTPVKQLSFQEAEPSTSTRAYLEGRVIMEQVEEDGQPLTVIAAPLLGKQGIYGVLQVTSDQRMTLSEQEADYIAILADTAGTAFENAQLYQQSRNLIRELRLINEMARQLNRSLDLKEILDFVITMMGATFDAEFCAILRKTPGEDRFDVLSSSLPELNGKTVDTSEKPFQEILQNKQALLLAQPGAGPLPFSLMPCCSLMGVPLVVEGEISGVLLVSDSRYHFF